MISGIQQCGSRCLRQNPLARALSHGLLRTTPAAGIGAPGRMCRAPRDLVTGTRLAPESNQWRMVSTRTGLDNSSTTKPRRTKRSDKETPPDASSAAPQITAATTTTPTESDPKPKTRRTRKSKAATLSEEEEKASVKTMGSGVPEVKQKQKSMVTTLTQEEDNGSSKTKGSPVPNVKQKSFVSPSTDLDELQALVDELNQTNSPITKRKILSEHPRVAHLLSWIYDPSKQFHVSSNNVLKYVQAREQKQEQENGNGTDGATMSPEQYDTIPELLNALSTRAITGHAALNAILYFMDSYCHDDSIRSKRKGSKDITSLFSTARSKLMLKILDKNLKAGCNVAMIKAVYPDLIQGFHVALGHSLSLEKARSMFGTDGVELSKSRKKSSKATEDDTTGKAESWYASRKLDGARCLVRINRLTGEIETLSRNGKAFESLGSIQTTLREIMDRYSPKEQPRNWNGFFARALGLDPSDPKLTETLPEQLILDGEMCVFAKENPAESSSNNDGSSSSGSSGTNTKTKAKSKSNSQDDDVIGGQGNEELGQELFLKTVGVVKRGWSEQGPSETVVYCIFDCLTGNEFADKHGARPFSERIQGVVRALYGASRKRGKAKNDSPSLLRILKQIKVKSFEQLEQMFTNGIEHGWEGVMLRKDTGYEGKRSRDLLKLKQFQDAEYVVQDVTLGSMRLPVDGQYEERDNVLTNVVILHRGCRVGVGSGFSVEDRIRFGKDPSLIVGKTITVKYFEESQGTSQSNGSAAATDGNNTEWSLRFPTVKAIYDKTRDI
ncbi:hypothetical protein BGX31_007446 [Mortierella sp. GBA43]|nr:hypothetical protein BGX31_007446 [Mortierella sp. GBA43]